MRSSIARARLTIVLGAIATGALALACNLIVGVEDVEVVTTPTPADDTPADDDGDDDTPAPDSGSVVPPAPAAEWVLAGGTEFTCAASLKQSKTYCWGANTRGQLGGAGGAKQSQPVPVTDVAAATFVGTGVGFACAITDGAMKCWGNNTDGQLGNGTPKADGGAAPVSVAGITMPQGMDGAESTACFHDNGMVKCVGKNQQMQFGDGTTTPSTTLKPVTLPEAAAGISMGSGHVCAWTASGAAYCWGSNGKGQVGNGSNANQGTPVKVNVTAVKQIVCGSEFTCALITGGAVQCWGDNTSAELGRQSGDTRVPGPVNSLTSVVQLTAGSLHACALLEDHTVRCWGSGQQGQLGNANANRTNSLSPVPLSVTEGKEFISVAAGNNHTCAERFDHTLMCWGDNLNGQLGNMTQSPAPTPTPVLFP